MALIARLMKRNDNGTPMGENAILHIPHHKFIAACGEIIQLPQRQTVAQVKTGLGMRTFIAPGDTRSDVQEFDALIVLAPTGTSALAIAQKSMYLKSLDNVLMLAQFSNRPSWVYPGYTTIGEILIKLGIP